MKLSKRFYVGSMVAGPVVGVVLFGLAFIMTMAGIGAGAGQGSHSPGDVGVVFGAGLGVLAFLSLGLGAIYSIVVYYVLLYKAWTAIQDGHARTTPAAAVGLMLVPMFNLYWQFQAIWGFAVDYNKYVSRH